MRILFGPQGGVYFEGVHRDIPEGAKEITSEQYAEYLSAAGQLKEVVPDANGMPLLVSPPPLPIDEQRKVAVKKINIAASRAIQSISASYPQFEIDTWDAQESEARAWLADSAVPTPTLSPIAAMRGISLADLVDRVIEKTSAFRPVVAAVVGKRQAIEDQIERATTQSEIDAIVLSAHDAATWSFN